jgi:hypothetical protein
MSEHMQLTAERALFVMLPRWLLYHPEVGEGAKFLALEGRSTTAAVRAGRMQG